MVVVGPLRSDGTGAWPLSPNDDSKELKDCHGESIYFFQIRPGSRERTVILDILIAVGVW